MLLIPEPHLENHWYRGLKSSPGRNRKLCIGLKELPERKRMEMLTSYSDSVSTLDITG